MSDNGSLSSEVLEDGESKILTIHQKKAIIKPAGRYQGPPIYKERNVIIQQPGRSADASSHRCPLPISVVSYDYNRMVLPYSGVQLFNDVEKISIEQMVDLDDLTIATESSNRFLIKGERGQVLFSGSESSSSWQRILCGSGRKFIFRIFDRSKQEAVFFTRKLACSTPPFGCFLQRLDVFVPLCEFIGSVRQLWTPMVSTFSVRNANNCEVFRIEGPTFCSCIKPKIAQFNVCRAGNLSSVTTITHQWDEHLVNYSMTVNFPPRICYNYKALLTACAILLEYMYFETSGSGRCINCCL